MDNVEFNFSYVKKFDTVAAVSYLLGIDDNAIDTYCFPARELLTKMRASESANIIRNLCYLRTRFFLKFKQLDNLIKFPNYINIDNPNMPAELLDYRKVKELENSIEPRDLIITGSSNPARDYNIKINQLISKYFDKTKPFFSEDVNFSFIRNFFCLDELLTSNSLETQNELLKVEFKKYHNHLNTYPHHCYCRFNPEEKVFGYLLSDDGAFLERLYKEHNVFYSRFRATDVCDDVKREINTFIDSDPNVVMAVDCENVDAYKLYGVLRNLGNRINNIEKIILFNDINSGCAWNAFKNTSPVPIEEIACNRVLEQKSIVDAQLMLKLQQDYYTLNRRTFILCSSDSDFIPLINSLHDARFTIFCEKEKTSPLALSKYKELGIHYYKLDDFYIEDGQRLLKDKVLNLVLHEKIETGEILGKSIDEVAAAIFKTAYAGFDEREIENFKASKLKKLQLKIIDGVYKIVA